MVNSDLESYTPEELSHRTLKEICIIDPRLFVSTKVKDTEVWSWKRKKSEKWFVFLDSNTGHLKQSKIG
ncbi:MAG: hypothetical protein ABJB76_10520 [Candidatus Nitrosocosmicus sp.]